MVLGAVLVVLVLGGEVRSQGLGSLDMEAVTARLGERFEEFRKYGLGADELEVRRPAPALLQLVVGILWPGPTYEYDMASQAGDLGRVHVLETCSNFI